DVFAGKKSAQIREILISESAWEEMTCLFAPSLEGMISKLERAEMHSLLNEMILPSRSGEVIILAIFWSSTFISIFIKLLSPALLG
ncbi:hypothetical protein EA136_24690, partial [Enterobacter hormaechei subsp. hoffmannii]